MDRVIEVLPKTGLKAGEGEETGDYPFYTCSQICSKRYNTYHFEPDAITMSTGGMATVNYVGERWTSSQDCYNFRTNQVTKYIFYSIFYKLPYIQEQLFKGMGLKHLQKKEFGQMEIVLPPLQEQQAIADYLDTKCAKIDAQIKYYTELITELKQYKQSVISEVVTGK